MVCNLAVVVVTAVPFLANISVVAPLFVAALLLLCKYIVKHGANKRLLGHEALGRSKSESAGSVRVKKKAFKRARRVSNAAAPR